MMTAASQQGRGRGLTWVVINAPVDPNAISAEARCRQASEVKLQQLPTEQTPRPPDDDSNLARPSQTAAGVVGMPQRPDAAPNRLPFRIMLVRFGGRVATNRSSTRLAGGPGVMVRSRFRSALGYRWVDSINKLRYTHVGITHRSCGVSMNSVGANGRAIEGCRLTA